MDLVLSPSQTTFSPVENSWTRQQKQPPITSARSGSVTPNNGFFFILNLRTVPTRTLALLFEYTITKNVLLVTLFVYYHCRFVLILRYRLDEYAICFNHNCPDVPQYCFVSFRILIVGVFVIDIFGRRELEQNGSRKYHDMVSHG